MGENVYIRIGLGMILAFVATHAVADTVGVDAGATALFLLALGYLLAPYLFPSKRGRRRARQDKTTDDDDRGQSILGWLWAALVGSPEPVAENFRTGEDFEDWARRVFERHGYAVKTTPRSGDHGIDLVLSGEGGLIAVQCKRYHRPVDEDAVRSFWGSIQGRGYRKGYFLTTSRFTRAARLWAVGKPIELWDSKALREL